MKFKGDEFIARINHFFYVQSYHCLTRHNHHISQTEFRTARKAHLSAKISTAEILENKNFGCEGSTWREAMVDL